MPRLQRLFIMMLAGIAGCGAQPNGGLQAMRYKVAVLSVPVVAGISFHNFKYDRVDAEQIDFETFSDASLQHLALDVVAANTSMVSRQEPRGLQLQHLQQEEDASTFKAAIYALEVVNAVVVAGLAGVLTWMFWGVSQRMEGETASTVTSWLFSLAPFILSWYCFLSISRFFFQYEARHVPLDPAVPTFVIYLLKLLVSLVMYRIANGSFIDLAKELTRSVNIWLLYMIPVTLNATHLALSFLALQQMSAAQYVILLHVRTILLAVLWEIVMSKRLSVLQWTLLFTCIYAVILTERATLQIVVATGMTSKLSIYATVAVQWLCSVLGGLAKEHFLKKQDLSVNAQNVVNYVLGSILLSAYLAGSYYLKPNEPLITVDGLQHLMVPAMACSIVSLTLLGVSQGFLLKYLGNIWKEIAGMLVTLLTASIDWFVFRTKAAGILDFEAVGILSMSICILALLEKLEIDPASSLRALSLTKHTFEGKQGPMMHSAGGSLEHGEKKRCDEA